MLLANKMFCQGDGHSLEINGPLHTREHSLLVIRRRRGLWADSAADRDFTPLCCTITCMHLRCTEKAYSCSLEFCLGGLYNNKAHIVWAVLFCSSGTCRLSFVCVLFYVISLVISNTQLRSQLVVIPLRLHRPWHYGGSYPICQGGIVHGRHNLL